MKASPNSSRFCVNFRSIANALAIGLGVGLATKNIAVGFAVGLVFVIAFTTRRDPLS